MSKNRELIWPELGRHVFFILPERFDPEHGYIAVTAVEGFAGIYASALYCGHDYETAIWYANQKNLFLGIDPETAAMIITNATQYHGINKRPI